MGRRFHTNSRGGVWPGSADHTRNCAILSPTGSRSRRRTRYWATDFIYTKRAHGSVDSRFSSLLEFAEACDVPVQWSCRTGVCHTCECGLIGGSVQYQPDPLEPPAAGNLLICCSRPCGDIEVDL